METVLIIAIVLVQITFVTLLIKTERNRPAYIVKHVPPKN